MNAEMKDGLCPACDKYNGKKRFLCPWCRRMVCDSCVMEVTSGISAGTRTGACCVYGDMVKQVFPDGRPAKKEKQP